MKRKRPLTEEEKQIWEYITRHDVPLRAEKKEDSAAQPSAVSADLSDNQNIKKPRLRARSDARNEAVSDNKILPTRKAPPVAILGDYANIDRNTAEKFRKGNAYIDAKLDLHGMTSANAHQKLISFILQHAKNNSRCLLVITGKGSGILRDSLPNWLDHPSLQNLVLAFDTARPKHGGEGAYYILLRRNRTS